MAAPAVGTTQTRGTEGIGSAGIEQVGTETDQAGIRTGIDQAGIRTGIDQAGIGTGRD